MAARVTDWGLAALVAALMLSGALTVFAGSVGDEWVFVAHDIAGVAIAVLLVVKLARVWPRVLSRARWERRTIAGVLATSLALGALGSGVLWSDGVTPAALGYSLLAWHDALGAVLGLAVVAHMVLRAKPLRRRDLSQRRQFLATAGMAGAALLAWRSQQPLLTLFRLRGARRRYTGSYEASSFAGNAFPTTSWVADDPRPLDVAAFRLRVHGMTDHELALSLRDIPAADELVATLDCTGGFYSTQRWQGARLARILDLAGTDPAARHLSVTSRTGYRWSFAIDDARELLLLATHVGGQPLSHEHGAPVRLVVPGARGFQWVKWVEQIELRATPDYGAPASTLWSSFTSAGSGHRAARS